ncbi:DgyrCDS980 [Dimorphilus gyrociliatus]|uniref:DgyrCDS980 n=1 Tax=Dimorphilus gyrociliatus TaxID=2664684 RepID=A0A7I8V5W2_9ANNE|nr:DgyrCDS980 [Dimorphilus gyrociliatus]
MTSQNQPQIINNFEIPSWAGKPPPGLHLDVKKDSKMIQKLMIDEKRVYFFGRNRQMCDFCIDHASCSRVHAVLVWHKQLNRPFIIDLGSTHGTYIGSIRLETRKPQAVQMDSELHFGASTRIYIIREKPTSVQQILRSSDQKSEELEGGLMGLPETETELDNLTEFNTATNRRIAAITDGSDQNVKRKRKSLHVSFNDSEEVINPEDIDPAVGRFRNLVHTVVVPTKKVRLDSNLIDGRSKSSMAASVLPSPAAAAVFDEYDLAGVLGPQSIGIAKNFNLRAPNLAPDVDDIPVETFEPSPIKHSNMIPQSPTDPMEPKKKKYAKEAWPGKKPTGPMAPPGNAYGFM